MTQGAQLSEPPSLSALAVRIGAGDAVAEGALVERFSRGLRAYIRRLGAPPDLADDLHQETFRVALERLRGEGLEDPEAMAGFLRGTARHLLLGDRRKSARRKTEPDEQAIAVTPDRRGGQLRQVLDDEASRLVRQLLAGLEPPRDREILYRFYLAEERKETICADLQLSSLHFNRVLHRARQRFKQLVERCEQGQSFSHA